MKVYFTEYKVSTITCNANIGENIDIDLSILYENITPSLDNNDIIWSLLRHTYLLVVILTYYGFQSTIFANHPPFLIPLTLLFFLKKPLTSTAPF